MKMKSLRKKTDKEIADLITKSRKEIEKLSLIILQGKEKNVKKVGFVRKTVARAKTVLKERSITKENKNGKKKI